MNNGGSHHSFDGHSGLCPSQIVVADGAGCRQMSCTQPYLTLNKFAITKI